MVQVMKMLAESSDEIDREVYKILRAWQDSKAAVGRRRSLGREPAQIAKYGSVAVIEGRVLNRTAGFDDGPEESYESIVDRFPNRFSEKIVGLARSRLKAARS